MFKKKNSYQQNKTRKPMKISTWLSRRKTVPVSLGKTDSEMHWNKWKDQMAWGKHPTLCKVIPGLQVVNQSHLWKEEHPSATIIHLVLVISTLGLRAGYKLFISCWISLLRKVILCRWIVLFFYAMTIDIWSVFVPSRPSEVWDQTLCSIPGYLPRRVPPQ